MKTWEEVQRELGDLPGPDGVQRRAAGYAPYFLRLGVDVIIGPDCRFYHPDRIVIEDGARINEGALIYGSGGVRIGRNARIGPRVFMHSANHDVSPGPTAFFERGYRYETVSIGDNSLISGNVSILPGASLGNGSFVAAGAVVVRGSYADDVQLMGVPARAAVAATVPPDVIGPADLLLVIPRREKDSASRFAAVARSILSGLGLPQVRIMPENELREGPNPVFLFGPPRWTEKMLKTRWLARRRPWRLGDGGPRVTGVCTVRLYSGEDIRIAARQSRQWAVASALAGANASWGKLASVLTYYAAKRLRKRAPDDNDHADWSVFAYFLRLEAVPDWFRDVAGDLDAKARPDIAAAIRDALTPDGDPHSRLLPILEVRTTLPEKWSKKALSTQPMLALRGVLAGGSAVDPNLVQQIEELVATTRRADHLSTFALAASVAGRNDLVDAAAARLAAEFTDNATGYVHVAIGSASYSYAPTLAAFVTLLARKEVPGFVPTPYRNMLRDRQWSLFAPSGAVPAGIEGQGGALVDTERRCVASTLLENWIECAVPPAMELDAQFELTAGNYANDLYNLDAVWLEVFRTVFHAEALDLVQVEPWPFPYRFGLSLRYDVDRPLASTQIQRVLNLQRERMNAACAAWYFFPENASSVELHRSLDCALQETGLHLLEAQAGAETGVGTTFHSAPVAEYWRGVASVAAVSGAAYTELLSTQSGRPRLVPVPRDEGVGEQWVTPLHFPMEGSMENEGLAYFDRLLEAFHRQAGFGGHVILASHPDVEQSHLDALWGREDFREAWCATVSEVVERCRDTLAHGAIRIVSLGASTVAVRSRRTLADVALVIHRRNAAPVRAGPVQLNAGHARTVAVPA